MKIQFEELPGASQYDTPLQGGLKMYTLQTSQYDTLLPSSLIRYSFYKMFFQ